MKLTFVEPNREFPEGYLEIDDARILWPNFEGRGDRFNKQGDRNFHLVIPDQEIAEALLNNKNKFGANWNVKIKQREDGEPPFRHMMVKVKFNNRGPSVYLQSGKRKVRLNEDTIKCLDDIDIVSVDMDIRPYDGEMATGQPFRTAYLSSMLVRQRVDRFATDTSVDEEEELDF